jgi:hypothetical protein
MKKLSFVNLLLWCACLGFSQTVPENYQALYDALFTKLNFIDSVLDARWNGEKFCTTYCTSLISANSTRGEVLLEPQVIEGIKIYLDALDSLGVGAVDLAVQYPILVESFPKSEDYLEFYKKVVQEIRNRGFQLIIGSQSTFRDTLFGHLDVDSFYIDLTVDRYRTEKKQMIETIITELQPDYFTIETEPSTMEMNLGLDFSPLSVIEYIEYFLDGLDKQAVLIGGGSGTWDDITYINLIAQQSGIDYIDYHIYPINRNCFIDKVFTIDSIAAQYNKKLVVGECWLHKVDDSELGVLPPHVLFARDIYSYWIPLDSIFTECMVKLSHHSRIELTSLIWATYFFAYVDYLPEYKDISLIELYGMALNNATPNIVSKTFSRTGNLYHARIRESCQFSEILKCEEKDMPCHFILEQNYPNPFNPITTIRYSLSQSTQIRIAVFNELGRRVRILYDGYQQTGMQLLQWNGRDDGGQLLTSGVYICRIQTEQYRQSIKLLVMR